MHRKHLDRIRDPRRSSDLEAVFGSGYIVEPDIVVLILSHYVVFLIRRYLSIESASLHCYQYWPQQRQSGYVKERIYRYSPRLRPPYELPRAIRLRRRFRFTLFPNDLANATLDIRDRTLASVGFPPNAPSIARQSPSSSALRAGTAYSETIAAYPSLLRAR